MTKHRASRAIIFTAFLSALAADLAATAAEPSTASHIASDAKRPPAAGPTVSESKAFAGLNLSATANKDKARLEAKVMNGSKSELREIHVRLTTYGADGKEALHANIDWTGSLPPGESKRIAMVDADFVGAPAAILGAASLKIQPIFASFGNGKSQGQRAPWAPAASELASQQAQIDQALTRDADKSKAYSASQGKDNPAPAPAPVYAGSAFAMKPNANPFDPADLAIAFGMANLGEAPIQALGTRSTFFKSDLSPFFKVDLGIDAALPPHQVFRGWIGIGSPRLDDAYRKDFEKAANGHGVNVEKSFFDPANPQQPQAEATKTSGAGP